MCMPIPSEVFDTILNDEEILKRARRVTENYDRFSKMAEDYFVKGKGDILDVKKQLYPVMIKCKHFRRFKIPCIYLLVLLHLVN